jgi:hypothetical protein
MDSSGRQMEKLRERLEDALGFYPSKNLYDRAFMYLFIVSLVLRLIWLDMPKGSLIFDER